MPTDHAINVPKAARGGPRLRRASGENMFKVMFRLRRRATCGRGKKVESLGRRQDRLPHKKSGRLDDAFALDDVDVTVDGQLCEFVDALAGGSPVDLELVHLCG